MPPTAFLFPGQGAQALGMGVSLADTLPAARRLFDEAREILGYDLLELCKVGPVEKLNATDVSQPAIFVSSLAALESLQATDAEAIATCTHTAGLSLGEYTALAFAGAISFQDGLQVVRERGRAMQAAADATPSGMVSMIAVDLPTVEGLVAQAKHDSVLEPANFLCPGNIVVSGAKDAIDRLIAICEAEGYKTIRLAVAGAFHTSIMQPADVALATALERVSLRKPRIPVWSNVDAQPHDDPEIIRGLLIRQVLQPVRWEETMRNLLTAGVERFYEIGPGKVLAGLLKRVHRKVDCRNIPA